MTGHGSGTFLNLETPGASNGTVFAYIGGMLAALPRLRPRWLLWSLLATTALVELAFAWWTRDLPLLDARLYYTPLEAAQLLSELNESALERYRLFNGADLAFIPLYTFTLVLWLRLLQRSIGRAPRLKGRARFSVKERAHSSLARGPERFSVRGRVLAKTPQRHGSCFEQTASLKLEAQPLPRAGLGFELSKTALAQLECLGLVPGVFDLVESVGLRVLLSASVREQHSTLALVSVATPAKWAAALVVLGVISVLELRRRGAVLR